jgi:predicted nucleic acid-binding protein
VKTYVFDASALFAFLHSTAGGKRVAALIKEAVNGRAEIVMSAVNYGEVYGWILREYGLDRAKATMSAVYPLPIRLVDVTPARAFGAAEVKSKYKLYYVDSFVAALAMEVKGTLVTSDTDFRRLGYGFPVLWLKT